MASKIHIVPTVFTDMELASSKPSEVYLTGERASDNISYGFRVYDDHGKYYNNNRKGVTGGFPDLALSPSEFFKMVMKELEEDAEATRDIREAIIYYLKEDGGLYIGMQWFTTAELGFKVENYKLMVVDHRTGEVVGPA